MSEPLWSDDGTLRSIGLPSWLADDGLQSLMAAFEEAGHTIYAVGGCVRDSAMGRPVRDVDLSTDALPDETTQIIEGLSHDTQNWKAVPTGIEHGTITAVDPNGGVPYEITTFRTDDETDGRHATVAFSTNIKDDATRRDFTINAFYADRTGNVRDIVGGSADLRAQRIRFIGDAKARIREDYLRILRFFRFTASHGRTNDGIDADGLAACAELADGLTGISRERIGAEMTRLIMEDNASPIIGSMEQSGVLHRILPGASVLTLARLIDLEESYPSDGTTTTPKTLATRLASLGCADIADRLRLSRADAKAIALVTVEAGATTPPHEIGYRHGYGPAIQCLLLRWASLLAPFDASVLPDVAFGADATFPIAAADLMPTLTGKALGTRLAALETAWIASKFQLDKSALLALP